MICTITHHFSKDELLAIGHTLHPDISDTEIYEMATVIVCEWVETTIRRKVRELMEKKS